MALRVSAPFNEIDVDSPFGVRQIWLGECRARLALEKYMQSQNMLRFLALGPITLEKSRSFCSSLRVHGFPMRKMSPLLCFVAGIVWRSTMRYPCYRVR